MNTGHEWQHGQTVKDTSTGRVGCVLEHEGPRCRLRPLNGGKEWDADPAALVPAAQSDAMSAGVAMANKRWGR